MKKYKKVEEFYCSRTDKGHREKQKKERARYGVSYCDTYSFDYSVGKILANSLFMYVDVASGAIKRDDFAIIEKHAQAIRDFAEADSWDSFVPEKKDKERTLRCREYKKKERAFKEAMKWLGDNWPTLWW